MFFLACHKFVSFLKLDIFVLELLSIQSDVDVCRGIVSLYKEGDHFIVA